MSEISTDAYSRIYTPTELNREARLHLEAGFPYLLLEAEVSNLSRPASGHLYFTLKDDAAQVRCAMFRSAAGRCKLQLENGSKVLARGRVSLYEARGDFQFIVDGLRDAGAGQLQAKFELLKAKLAEEGLFDARHKRPLPSYPLRIGIITSPSGAAIQDIRQVLQRRWPVAEIRLYPVAVQGTDAPPEICAALAGANRERWAELLILGRGGGSLEDLQAFNEESVARAIAASVLPVISAVGHETDFSIADFVADLRAPTPSAAAELATPHQSELNGRLDRFLRLFGQRMQSRLQLWMQNLDHLAHRLSQRDPAARLSDQARQLEKLELALRRAPRQRVQDLRRQLAALVLRLDLQHPGIRIAEYQTHLRSRQQAAARSLARALHALQERTRDLARTLHAVSPLATMGRGYAVLLSTGGVAVSTAAQVSSGQQLQAQLADGRLYCTVDEVSDEGILGRPPAGNRGPA